MSIFGLMTKQERAELQREIAMLKAEQEKYQPWLMQTAEAEQWTLPDPSIAHNQADLFRTSSHIASAVGAVADTISLAPGKVYKPVKGGEPKEITGHEFELLLANPNPEDSRTEFLYGTAAYYELNGNAVWWLNKANEKAPPDEMWVIPPSMIRPIPDGKMYLKGYLYFPGNGAEIFLEPWEVVWHRRYNQDSRFVGLSLMECIAIVAAGDEGMKIYNTKFFKENNGRLPGILTFEQMIQDDQWRKIKDDTREKGKNREIMMLRGTGAGGVKWMPIANTQKDMEFLQGREANKAEVYSLYPGLSSMTDPSATEANANAGKRTFAENVIWPRLVRIAEKIVNKIFYSYGNSGKNPVYEDGITFAFDDPRITDRQLELQERAADEKVMTVAEIRKKYAKAEPLGDERDELFIVQVTAQTGQPEPPAPVIVQAPPEEEEKPETIPGQEPMEETEDVEPDNSELKADLNKWKRKAVKKIGQAVPFESDVIPPEVNAEIYAALPACKTDAEVRALFAKPITVKAVPVDNGALLVMQSIEAALKALDKIPAPVQPLSVTIQNHPNDPTPITFAPTIEAAKAPDVQVTVEAAKSEPILVQPADVVVVQSPAEKKERKPRKTKVQRTDGGYVFTEEE